MYESMPKPSSNNEYQIMACKTTSDFTKLQI